MIKKMINVNEVKDFGDGRFVLNLDKQELYKFLKKQLPKGYIDDTFDEFMSNLKVEEYESDDIQEVGLTYTKQDENGLFELSLVDDFLYTKFEGDYQEFEEGKLVENYEKFIAARFPEFEKVWLKRIEEKDRHYRNFYKEDGSKRAYQIYKANVQASRKYYKKIFGKDCPIEIIEESGI